MKFNGTDRYCDTMKRVSSLSPMKKMNISDQREDEYLRPRSNGAKSAPIRLRLTKAGPRLCESSKKDAAAAAFCQPSEEDLDLYEQFGNDSESMWLSTDCSSPSAFFREYRWSDSFHSNELLLPSWLSLLTRENPMEEASNLPMRKASRDEDNNLEEDMKDEKIVTWLLSSAKSDANARGCSVTSSTPLSTKSDSSQSLDFERIGFRVSLLNLDGEDNKLIPGADPKLDYFLSDFPSPSYKSNWGHEFQSCNFSSGAQSETSGCDFSSEHASEAADCLDLNTDEPLFWPYEQKIDWNSEATWNYFSMSPRKDVSITTFGSPPDSVQLSHHDRNIGLKEGQRRRLVFSSGSAASKIMELKQRYNKGARRTITLPSRLSRATKTSAKIVPLNMKDDTAELKDRKAHVERPVDMVKAPIEEGSASKELPIEMFLGLDEFDGHEGVDSEFDKDDFSLHLSLR
ncbi:uncharacterized protein Pyn_18647 [Prunus yedoensis var. nudiflora]|uniref:Uncharacterized protein n=1 Tax=Prunus yedoensis var. nudiflora TaxID=2094558 RepID=A0A314UEA7_PRUYE|nr:uncharacterized protein Pyn_18647 [Prunus yedoensis var. nudiflora]